MVQSFIVQSCKTKGRNEGRITVQPLKQCDVAKSCAEVCACVCVCLCDRLCGPASKKTKVFKQMRTTERLSIMKLK